MLGQDAKKEVQESDDERLEEALEPQAQFPNLPWKSDLALFTWRVMHEWPLVPSKWPIKELDWLSFGTFTHLLRWHESPELKVSFTELAVFICLLETTVHTVQ